MPPDWSRATVCPGWDVHDVVGHVLNDYLRRLSGSRDGFAGAVFANDETLPSYLARANDEFVRATRQCSPEVMVELLAHLGPQLDQLWRAADLSAPADLDVSWAALDDLWRLATRGITPAEGRRRAVAEGDPVLVDAATSLLAVIT